MECWYYQADEMQKGPVSTAKLTTMIENGGILRSTKVWKEGMLEWKPAGSIEGLFRFPPSLDDISQDVVSETTEQYKVANAVFIKLLNLLSNPIIAGAFSGFALAAPVVALFVGIVSGDTATAFGFMLTVALILAVTGAFFGFIYSLYMKHKGTSKGTALYFTLIILAAFIGYILGGFIYVSYINLEEAFRANKALILIVTISSLTLGLLHGTIYRQMSGAIIFGCIGPILGAIIA